MSTRKSYNNTGRSLPNPPDSAHKAQSKNRQIPPKRENLASLVLQSPSERPQMPVLRQEFQDNAKAEATGKPVSQTSAPDNPPSPILHLLLVSTTDHTTPDQPQPNSESVDSPSEIHLEMPPGETFRSKVQRRPTESRSGMRPTFLKSIKFEPQEPKNNSPQLLPMYSLSRRALCRLNENDIVNFDQKLDDLAAEFEDEFSDALKESNNPQKEPKKSSELAASLDDLRIEVHQIPVRNSSGASSPDEKPARRKLQRVSHAKKLPITYRLPREIVPLSNTAAQNNPSDAGSGSEN